MRIEFRADRRPATTRVEEWRNLLSSTVGALEALDPPDVFVGGRVGALRVAEMAAGGAGRATRTARHVRRDDADGLYKIDVLGAGRGLVEQGGRRASLQPGDLTFVDLARPADWRMDAARCVAVVFPPELLPFGRDELRRLCGERIAGKQGAGALVSSLARQLPRQLDALDPAGAVRIGTAVVDLLAATLAARLDRPDAIPPEGRRRALLVQVQAHIEQRLDDPALSPARIASAHYISLRYLHKLFETEETTVAAWIRRRRLERCRRDLLDPARRGEPVGATAARWGLPDPAHFSRAFRAAYGAPPGEYRRRHALAAQR